MSKNKSTMIMLSLFVVVIVCAIAGGTWGATGFWSRHITFGDTTYTMREYTENFAGKIKYRYSKPK